MRKYSDTKANKIIGILLVIFIVACFILVIIRNQLNQHITEICEYKCKELANSAIATAINEQLKGSVDNKNYISVQRNNNNEIISIETNTEEINKLQLHNAKMHWHNGGTKGKLNILYLKMNIERHHLLIRENEEIKHSEWNI